MTQQSSTDLQKSQIRHTIALQCSWSIIPILVILSLSILGGCSHADPAHSTQVTGVLADTAMIVTAHPLATEVGLDILSRGGNAWDAAIAVQFTLAVVYPRAGNIGGGGFMVSRDNSGKARALNFREMAPLAAHRDMYLNQHGEVIEGASTLGHLAIGVPGVVAGLWDIHQQFGIMPWKDLLTPAFELAHTGFILTEKEANKLNQYQADFLEQNDSSMVFLNPEGWAAGDVITLPNLARTLEIISIKGRDGFYTGEVARLMLDEIQSNGGIITQQDLDMYTCDWTDPIESQYRGYRVMSMPPPSSGGIALLQLLKGIEPFDPNAMGQNSAELVHLMSELERRVYADRSIHLGDPNFWDVPIDMLLDPDYLLARNADISMDAKTDSEQIQEGRVDHIESVETTHFSIVDKDRNAVAITTTLNGNYGSKVLVDGAGFFLNNEMDDFSIKPGVPNMYGLVGGEANAIQAKKRMLSSMTPTILEKNGELFMVLGTPGGATIITSVFQNILNVVDHDMGMLESVQSTRVHHQWLPDRILYEEGRLPEATKNKLRQLGHELESRIAIGRVDAVLVLPDGSLEGAADSRGDDKAQGY